MKTAAILLSILLGFSSISYGQAEPPYGMSELEAYSVFHDAYRSGDYELAVTFGEWMLEAKPRQIQGHGGFNLVRQFERFITIYTEKAQEESDPSAKSRLFEQALGVFDLAAETFDEDEIDQFQWTYRKGRFYQENHSDLDGGIQNAYEYYERAYEMDPQRFAETSDGYYARVLLSRYVSQGERDKALAFIETVEGHAGSSLSQEIEEARNELFQDPEERIGFLEERLDDAEDREAALSELATLYDQVGDRDRAREIAEELYELNPNFENTRKLADLALSNAEYGQAVEYLREALELSPDESGRKNVALEISEAYQNLGELQSSREYARRAIDLDSSFGDAYMQIASIYAAVISRCTSGRSIDRDDRTVYWLVVDYLEQAKEADSSVTNRANRQIESYRPVMPSSEDKFFRGWEDGESFHIGGEIRECYAWIDETTTVR